MIHVTWPRPFQGWFATTGLVRVTISLSTKLEVYGVGPISAPSTNIEKAIQNVEIGMVYGVVMVYIATYVVTRPLEIAPFIERICRVLLIKLTFHIVNMSLSCTISEIYRDICRKSPILTYPACILRPHWAWTRWNSPRSLIDISKLVTMWRCLRE